MIFDMRDPKAAEKDRFCVPRHVKKLNCLFSGDREYHVPVCNESYCRNTPTGSFAGNMANQTSFAIKLFFANFCGAARTTALPREAILPKNRRKAYRNTILRKKRKEGKKTLDTKKSG